MASLATLFEENTQTAGNVYDLAGQLHGMRDRHRVVATIQSIAIELSGSDEVAIFEVDATRTRLNLVTASSIDACALMSIPIGIGLIGQAVETGEVYERFVDPDASLAGERHLRACIPLRIDRNPVGAIAIFDRHGHYLVQDSMDRQWIDVFAKHAAAALYWTGIYESAIAALNSDW